MQTNDINKAFLLFSTIVTYLEFQTTKAIYIVSLLNLPIYINNTLNCNTLDKLSKDSYSVSAYFEIIHTELKKAVQVVNKNDVIVFVKKIKNTLYKK